MSALTLSQARTLIDTSRFPADKLGSAYLAPQVVVNVNHRMLT